MDLFSARFARFEGGVEAAKWDIFLSVTYDGFQCFKNKNYDCWPILAMVENLPPEIRFLMRNAVPLAFVKGPREATELHTFMMPISEEVKAINSDGGTTFKFWDGVSRTIQIHFLFMKGDSPATAKIVGTTGSNGKCPCRFCVISGCRVPGSNHEYCPSVVRLREESEDGDKWRLKRMFDPENLPLRSRSDIVATWNKFEDPYLSRAKKAALSTATGIKPRTVVFEIPSVFPYDSFPIDIMHISMNIVKDMMKLWKGEHPCCLDEEKKARPFVVSKGDWAIIDRELQELGRGASHSVFGPKPRDSTEHSKWKAAECRTFMNSYALVVLDGRLAKKYMVGLAHLCNVLDMCFWPSFS